MNSGLFYTGMFSVGLGFFWTMFFSKRKDNGEAGIGKFMIKGSVSFVLIIGGIGIMAYSMMT